MLGWGGHGTSDFNVCFTRNSQYTHIPIAPDLWVDLLYCNLFCCRSIIDNMPRSGPVGTNRTLMVQCPDIRELRMGGWNLDDGFTLDFLLLWCIVPVNLGGIWTWILPDFLVISTEWWVGGPFIEHSRLWHELFLLNNYLLLFIEELKKISQRRRATGTLPNNDVLGTVCIDQLQYDIPGWAKPMQSWFHKRLFLSESNHAQNHVSLS